MSVMSEYIKMTQEGITQYMKLVFEKKFNKQICESYIKTYIDVRYYNVNERGNHKTLRREILESLKEKKKRLIVDNKTKQKLIEDMEMFFIYVLYIDKVTPYKTINDLVKSICRLRVKILKKEDEKFRKLLKNFIEDDINKKEEFLEKFESKVFSLKLSDYNSINDVQRVSLKYHMKFSEIFSSTAIERAFNTGTTNEDKLFVEYNMISAQIIKDIIKGNFKKQYIVEFADSLFEKKQKILRLLNIIDNSAIQDKLSLKIKHETFLKYREEAYELLRSGYRIALLADETIDTDRAELEKLKMFKYILINKDAPYYEEIVRKKTLQNIIEI